MHLSRIQRFIKNKSLVSKACILVLICFLATILMSASFFLVTSHDNYNANSLLNLGLYHAVKLYNDADSDVLLPEDDATKSDFGNGEALEHEIQEEHEVPEQQNSGEEDKTRGMESCAVDHALMRIYMYNLPTEFHFGMIRASSVYRPWPLDLTNFPAYPGGLTQQHSLEYWLTADLLTSTFPDRHNPCTVVRVKEPKLADAFFIPYFSSLSYNKYSRIRHRRADFNLALQQRLVNFLLGQEAWKNSGGRNHIIPMHHPNSLRWVRQSLRNATFIVADFGRFSNQVANIAKDVVAPYKHILPYFYNDSTSFDSRNILLFFQGGIIRKEVLSYLETSFVNKLRLCFRSGKKNGSFR